MKVNITRSTGDAISRKIQLDLSFDGVQLLRFLRQSRLCWMGEANGIGVCIWGLIPPTLLAEQAYLWLWTCELAEPHQFFLVRYSRSMIKEMLEEYPILVGHCAVDDPRAQRWLKWLGAEFDFPSGKLISFTIRRK